MGELKTGKVWLAGAGPGDAGLLTVRTKEMMEEADTVVYDALVSVEILSMIPEETEKINVGKRSDHHLVPQKEINRILADKAKEGKKVLRLKGGDPFVFGRGGEETELLAEEGIPFEIVPGITSGVAVPAYAGIPVTHRDYTSSFHVVTGHARKGGTSRIDYEALVKMDATLIFLMGVTALPEICEKLRTAGMPDDTPAAVIQEGTLACQRSVHSDLLHLPDKVKEEDIQAPAIIVVGKVCRLSGRFDWMRKRPLGGKQILVTRPREQGKAFAKNLRRLGAQVIEFPTIRTKPLSREKERDRIRNVIEKIGKKLEEKRIWIVFTSAVGVDSFFEFLKEEKIDIRMLWRSQFAVIGSGTGEALKKRGIKPDLMPEVYEARELGKELTRRCGNTDLVVAFRAKEASQELFPPIMDKGVECLDIPIYETVSGADTIWKDRISRQFAEGKIDYVTFTSASTVRGFVQTMVETVDLKRIHALCIGRKTQEEAEHFGMHAEVSEEATTDSMVKWLLGQE